MTLYSYGSLPPRTHFTVRPFSAHPVSALPRPAFFDAYAGDASAQLEDNDQNGWNGCVGFATAQIVRRVLVQAGMGDPGQLSPWFVWDATKLQEYGDESENLGVDPHDALTIVRNRGIPTLQQFSSEYDDSSNVESDTGKGIEFYLCTNFDEILTGMGTLGVPGDFCIAVYSDFETPLPNGTVADPSGDVQGYHNIILRSYDDNRQRCRVHNQWKGWTKDNEVELTYDQARAMFSQAYIVTHPQIASPADAFWQWWGAASTDAVANKSVDELLVQQRVLGQWLPYLQASKL